MKSYNRSYLNVASLLFLVISIILAGCGTESEKNYQITTNVSPSGSGTISPGEGVYQKADSVSFEATPSSEYRFARWEGDLQGTLNPHPVMITQDLTITAIFEKRAYPLNINIEGEGFVREEVIQAKNTDYEHGTIVQLTAAPDSGWEFQAWGEDLEGTENPIELTINSAQNITAIFTKQEMVDMYPLELGRCWTYSYYYSDLDAPYENERLGTIEHTVINEEQLGTDSVFTLLETFEYEHVYYKDEMYSDTLQRIEYAETDTFTITQTIDFDLRSTGTLNEISQAFNNVHPTYNFNGRTAQSVKRYLPKKDIREDSTLVAKTGYGLSAIIEYVFKVDSGITSFSYKDRSGSWIRIEQIETDYRE